MHKRFVHYWPLLAAVVLTLLFFYKLAFTDLILGRGDTFAYFYPYWNARNTALAAGHLPLWTPDIFMGVPLLANPQLGTFYPPNWLTIPFNPPDAIRISVLMHITWAILGAFMLARHTLKLTTLAALLAGIIFGLGGFVGAHIEQINQLQGVSWMPWLFLIFHHALDKPVKFVPLLAMALALQVFTGHTQTVFITLVGLGMYGLVSYRRGTESAHPAATLLRQILRAGLILGLAGIIALLLAVPQIIPSAELTGLSNRDGGLPPNEATAFSLSPLVMGRGLLPSYDGQLFGEYVAYCGVIGLGLAITGIFMGSERSGRIRWLIITLIGLTFALGLYNPIYWSLASLPGFNFFRVPARWLALFGLGAAILAGMGLQALLTCTRHIPRRMPVAVVLVIGALVGASSLMVRAPADDITGPALPTVTTYIGWAAALAALVILLIVPRRTGTLTHGRLATLAALVELFVASQILPLNDPVSPDVYTTQRFTASQMRAYANKQTPPGRFLSISDLLFDPGDKATLEARYRRLGMDDAAIRHALVGTKKQEMLFPNLPLQWGLPSIDGFDGGLLPTVYYTQFTSLMLPAGEPRTIDGRLAEIMAQDYCRGACIPAQRWLTMTDTQYVITDKVFDLWHDGIAYDTQLPVHIDNKPDLLRDVYLTASYTPKPVFAADAVDVLWTGESAPSLTVRSDDLTISAENIKHLGTVNELQLTRFQFDLPLQPVLVDIAADAPTTIYAVTLVDTRTGNFQQLSPFGWERMLSSDIKLYENTLNPQRAYIVGNVILEPDTWAGSEAALEVIRSEDFIPYETAVIHGDAPALLPGSQSSALNEVNIVNYSVERVEVDVSTGSEGYLILADAYFPGWTATVNGEPANVYRADVMFRAVRVPAGESTVIFEYKPAWQPWILIAGGVTWLVVIGAAVWLWRGKRHRNTG